VAIFESDRGWNAHGGPQLLPRNPRHVKGDNYGFADGHAKWYARKSEAIPGQSEPRWLKAPRDEKAVTWEPKVKHKHESRKAP
jgi:prepilin-type processing-associated H-X9-DG protein